MKLFGNALDGLPLKNQQATIFTSFDDENLILEEMGSRRFKVVAVTTFKIPLKNIQAALVTTEKEFIEQSKSVIGRGVAGGLLFGPAGIFLGGLSGIGSKKKAKSTYLYVIAYTSSDGDTKNITLSLPGSTLRDINKFDEPFKAKLGLPEALEAREVFL